MKSQLQIAKNLAISLIIVFFNSSCNSLDPEIEISNSNHNKINSRKIVLFPTSAGQKDEYNEDTKKVHSNIVTNLKKINGLDEVAYGGIEIRKIADSISKTLYHKITLDLLSKSENSLLKNNTTFKIFLKKINKKFGNYNLMITNISGDQDSFFNNKEIVLIIGLYDINKFSWIYKVKASYNRSKINNWPLILDILSSEGINAISVYHKS